MSTPVRFFALGFSLLGSRLARYLESGAFSPHIRAGLAGGSPCLPATGIPIIAPLRDVPMRRRFEQQEMPHLRERGMHRTGEPGTR